MRRFKHIIVGFIICSAAASTASAELIELGRDIGLLETDKALQGLTERLPNKEHLSFNKPKDFRIPATPSSREIMQQVRNNIVSPQFPITTSLRYSSQSTTVEINALLRVPLCIIGADEGSLQWLSRNKAYLVKQQAICAIASASNQQAYEVVQAAAKPLTAIAIPIDEIAALHGIGAYPVLVIGNQIPGLQ